MKIKPGTVETSPKRVRVYKDGQVVADSTEPRLVWENPFYPQYYFPESDVRVDLLDPALVHRPTEDEPGGGRRVPLLRLDWDAMDAWFEEDEEIIVHPRSPYTRVDALRSQRHIRVEVDGVEVANSTAAVILFETYLPTRYYLPKTDVRMDLLSPSDTQTSCPYKGTANYYDVTIDGATHEDLVWWYPSPLPESAPIANHVCFFNEKVDIFVDGEPLRRPRTKWS